MPQIVYKLYELLHR